MMQDLSFSDKYETAPERLSALLKRRKEAGLENAELLQSNLKCVREHLAEYQRENPARKRGRNH